MTEHDVRQGECLCSIAYEYGHLPKTIWDDSANQHLKQLRKDPDVLHPGDVLQVPDIRVKEVDGATDKKHKFVRKSTLINLHIQLRLEDQKMANEDFEMEIDGKPVKGKTDGNGNINAKIKPFAERGWLKVRGRKIDFTLGGLDPVETVTGQQQRLNQLGFFCGPVDGIHGQKTSAGLRAFQKKHGLSQSGSADRTTIDRLKQDYGS